MLWYPLGVLNWKYEKRIFDTEQIMDIGACRRFMEALDDWGDQLFIDKQRRSTWLAQYMLENGKAPVPILVLEGEEFFVNPQCGSCEEPSIKSYQLIEGHMRTAYLRGMIKVGFAKLKKSHEIWVASRNT